MLAQINSQFLPPMSETWVVKPAPGSNAPWLVQGIWGNEVVDEGPLYIQFSACEISKYVSNGQVILMAGTQVGL